MMFFSNFHAFYSFQVELQQNGENTWRKYRMLPVFTDKVHHVIEDSKLVEAVRVRLCFEDEESCGNSINADIGE